METIENNLKQAWMRRLVYVGLFFLLSCIAGMADIDKETISKLITGLTSGNLSANRDAMADLIKIGQPAVESLIQCLNDPNELTRISAAEALGIIGNQKAVPSLIKRFENDAYASQWAAAEALGNIGDPRAVEPLINGLRNAPPELRSAIVTALNKIGDPRAVPTLVEFLKDENPDVRVSAARVVGRLGGSEVISAIMPCLNDGNAQVRLAAAEALGRLSATTAVDSLIQMLEDKNDDVRRAGATALGNIGDPRAILPLSTALQQYEAGQRIAIVGALGALGNPAGAAPVIALLRDEREDVRKAAVSALSQMGAAASQDLIVCLSDYNPEINATAAYLLGEIGNPDARDALSPLLTNPNDTVRSAAAVALDKTGYMPEDLNAQIDFYIALGNWDAIHQLGELALTEMVERLQSQNATARILTLGALENIGRRDILPLTGLLAHSNSSVRLFSAEALGRTGNESAIAPLTELMRNDENEYVRKYAARALNQLGQNVPIPKIAPIVIESADTDKSAFEERSATGETSEEASSSSSSSNILGDLPLLSF